MQLQKCMEYLLLEFWIYCTLFQCPSLYEKRDIILIVKMKEAKKKARNGTFVNNTFIAPQEMCTHWRYKSTKMDCGEGVRMNILFFAKYWMFTHPSHIYEHVQKTYVLKRTCSTVLYAIYIEKLHILTFWPLLWPWPLPYRNISRTARRPYHKEHFLKISTLSVQGSRRSSVTHTHTYTDP